MGAAEWLRECARVVAAERDRLTELDSAIGDADHGANLDRGFLAITAELDSGPLDSGPLDSATGQGALLVSAGSILIRRVGGASGPLYGSALRAMGKALSGGGSLPQSLEAAVEAVERLGKAAEGDKTMVDALRPAVRAMAQAVQDGLEEKEALDWAARAAEACEGDHPPAGAQGQGQLPGRAQRGTPGPRRDVGGHAGQGAGGGVVKRARTGLVGRLLFAGAARW